MAIFIDKTEINFLNQTTDLGLYFKQEDKHSYTALSIGIDTKAMQKLAKHTDFDFQIRPYTKNYIQITAIKK